MSYSFRQFSDAGASVSANIAQTRNSYLGSQGSRWYNNVNSGNPYWIPYKHSYASLPLAQFIAKNIKAKRFYWILESASTQIGPERPISQRSPPSEKKKKIEENWQ